MVLWCHDNLFTIITIVPVLWVIRRLFYRIQPRWFVYFLHLFNSNGLGPFKEESKDHFASLSSIVSHDPELRKKKAIRILEIGVGTGVNSCHYPDGSHLVAVDRNPHLKSYWENCRKRLPNIHTGELLVASGRAKIPGVCECLLFIVGGRKKCVKGWKCWIAGDSPIFLHWRSAIHS
ncbi:uncharacterized protein LOC121858506 [Homarus americanus]|uniref:uncharacterized protein LOC121858506 n=1 Tax=Homarus americanus TaxID=6706 RepID=UPI001C4865EE|nr:uncharacterized protein LOC121858506 [Homarus americanus]